MRLKGEMVIELADSGTGQVETVRETNMITDAVNNILGMDPMGIYLKPAGSMTVRFCGTGPFPSVRI